MDKSKDAHRLIAEDETLPPTVPMAPMKLPAFWPDAAEVWFAQADAQFAIKFSHGVAVLPQTISWRAGGKSRPTCRFRSHFCSSLYSCRKGGLLLISAVPERYPVDYGASVSEFRGLTLRSPMESDYLQLMGLRCTAVGPRLFLYIPPVAPNPRFILGIFILHLCQFLYSELIFSSILTS